MCCQELDYNNCLAHFRPIPGRERISQQGQTNFLVTLTGLVHTTVCILRCRQQIRTNTLPHPYNKGIGKVEQDDKFPWVGSNFWERLALETTDVPRQLPCPSDS